MRKPVIRYSHRLQEWVCHFPEDRYVVSQTGYGKTPSEAFLMMAALLHWDDCRLAKTERQMEKQLAQRDLEIKLALDAALSPDQLELSRLRGSTSETLVTRLGNYLGSRNFVKSWLGNALRPRCRRNP